MSIMKLTLMLSFIFAVLFSVFWAQPWRYFQPARESVHIFAPSFYSSALLILADKRNLFAKNGIDVKVDYLDYGKDCIEKMIAGEGDMSVAYLTPVVSNLKKKNRFKILTELHNSSGNTKIVYRKDLLVSLDDFYTQKVGLVRGTNAEFLLNVFAGAKALDVERFDIVDLGQVALQKQLLEGKISAAVFWQPRAHNLMAANPSILTSFVAPFYNEFSVLTATERMVQDNPEAVDGVVKSLVEAQQLFTDEPESSNKIIGDFLDGSGDKFEPKPYTELAIQLGLSQLLMTMLNSEWEWLSGSAQKEAPKGLLKTSVFEAKFLRKYAPERVTFK